MAKKPDRIIIDTNLWISFLLTKDFKKLDERIIKGKVRILFSLELIEEFLNVVERPKLKRYFNLKDVEQLVELFDIYGEIIEVQSKVNRCRDIKDNFILALAKDSKADFLITGDQDLLVLKEFEGTQITSITDYLKTFKGYSDLISVKHEKTPLPPFPYPLHHHLPTLKKNHQHRFGAHLFASAPALQRHGTYWRERKSTV